MVDLYTIASIIIVYVSELNTLNKKQRFSHWIKKYYPIMCCLQETQM